MPFRFAHIEWRYDTIVLSAAIMLGLWMGSQSIVHQLKLNDLAAQTRSQSLYLHLDNSVAREQELVNEIVSLHSEEVALEKQQEQNADRIHELMVKLEK